MKTPRQRGRPRYEPDRDDERLIAKIRRAAAAQARAEAAVESVVAAALMAGIPARVVAEAAGVSTNTIDRRRAQLDEPEN